MTSPAVLGDQRPGWLRIGGSWATRKLDVGRGREQRRGRPDGVAFGGIAYGGPEEGALPRQWGNNRSVRVSATYSGDAAISVGRVAPVDKGKSDEFPELRFRCARAIAGATGDGAVFGPAAEFN